MEKKAKLRLDAYLTEQGLFETRSRAQAAIMAGQVLVDEMKIDKPGTSVKEGAKIRILGDQLRYVSRGGLKLAKALQKFPVSVAGKVMADIGASTGGFTDCALQNGAVRVYAIDVGYGQLDWKLRNDPRVINMERTNARLLEADSLPEPIEAASIDVAFISLEKILPAVRKLLAADAFVIALVKPQFEAGKEIDKPGTSVKEGAKIRILGDQLRYVSRGGLKLAKALQKFPVSVAGKVMADIGASTGGFTDCALQNGAVRVYAIDVGYGQLDWKLRNDPRVINMERTNARLLEADSLPEPIEAASIDVAFISLEKILPAVRKLLAADAFVIALVKPQFEAGKENVGKKGVVRDPAVHKEVLRRIIAFAEQEGFGIGGLDYSPVKGPEGNIEYLLYLTATPAKNVSDTRLSLADIDRLVSESHAILDNKG